MRQKAGLAMVLILIFSLLFILGVNSGELDFLLELNRKVCLPCIGLG